MKTKNYKKVTAKIVLTILVWSLSSLAFAATTPSLGFANSFGLLSSTFTRNGGITIINGDLGYTTLSGGSTHTVSGATHVADSTYNTAGTDQGVALAALNAQACTYTFPVGAIDLATDITHGPVGVYTPGVYCNTPTSATSIGTAGVTLDGIGTYIFRMDGALTTVNNSNIRVINGASSCDVFWTPSQAATLGANTTFIGTIIDASGITVGNKTSWNGKALAFGGTVTMDTNIISSTCSSSNPVVITDPVIVVGGSTSTSSSGSSVTYGCKDSKATNYNYFSSSNPALCKYASISTVVISHIVTNVITPTFPKTGFPNETNSSLFEKILSIIQNIFK